jgi:hypothetical protein
MWDVREKPDTPLRGANNILLTQALFVEFGNEDAPYTLKVEHLNKNGKTYVSLCKVFLESVDEYEAAMRLVGSWKHWQRLCDNKWFSEGWEPFNYEGLNSLRETMKLRDKSAAKRKLMEAMDSGNVTAAKILLDSSGSTNKRGPAKRVAKDTSADAAVVDLFKRSKAEG